MTDYKATPEQWAQVQKCADAVGSCDCSAILELRARVETLEAAAHKHIVETSANILALALTELRSRAEAALTQSELQQGPPKNCWLEDEPDLCPSPCVFDDPSEVISNCVYAQLVKCKTDCGYYRNVLAQPVPQQEADHE